VVTDPISERRPRLRPALADAAQREERRTMPIPYAIEAEMKAEVRENDILREIRIYGGDESYIVIEDNNEWEITAVTPTLLSLLNTNSQLDLDINYSQVTWLTITGTGISPNGNRISWTTGNTQDEITVQGTRNQLPIDIWSGGGNDEIRLEGLIGIGSTVDAGDGNDWIYGSSRGDILWGGAGEDNIEGGDGNDALTGGDGNDGLRGEGGNDILSGGAGDDTVSGGSGEDTLYGGDGDDILISGAGIAGGMDILVGGPGYDIFRFTSVQDSSAASPDWIEDFERGYDKIDLSAIGGLHYIGDGFFTGTPGEVSSSSFALTIDIDGDTAADMIIFMPYPFGAFLTAADFVF
jgi:Ca2+-binding RTX toxin-like protein